MLPVSSFVCANGKGFLTHREEQHREAFLSVMVAESELIQELDMYLW